MIRPGVQPPSERQLARHRRASIGALPADAGFALGWLRRGPVATSPLLPLAVRRSLLRRGGVTIGRLVYGLISCYFGSGNVSIGDGSFINAGCCFEGAGRIEIGASCMLGPQVMILTSTHAIGDDGSISRTSAFRPVVLEDGCWIGARATILPGVTVGAGAVVAAGAVVHRDCEPGVMYGGVPARALRPVAAPEPASERQLELVP